jgi:chromosome partitioning protein
MIYTSGGTKGGSGKSTFATNLAVYLSSQGRDVLLVDADDQGTSSEFTNIRDETMQGKTGYTSIQLTGSALRTQVLNQQDKYDDIIVDVGGRDTGSQRAALTVTDACIIPFKPKSFDVWTLEKIEELVEEARTFNPHLKAFSFLNEAFTNAKIKDNDEAAEELKESQTIKFLDTTLHNRKAFSDSTANGLGVIEMNSHDNKAIKEFEALFKAIQKACKK